MQRLCAMVLAVACVAIYSWFCTWATPVLILRTALRGM